MVNYKAIADEVDLKSYPNYEAAFAAMSIETIDRYKPLTSNDLRKWAVQNPTDYATIKANGDVLTEMALKQIEIDSSDLNLADIEARGFVNALPISAAGKTALFTMAAVKVNKWQGLKPGHIQNAMQKREAGVI